MIKSKRKFPKHFGSEHLLSEHDPNPSLDYKHGCNKISSNLPPLPTTNQETNRNKRISPINKAQVSNSDTSLSYWRRINCHWRPFFQLANHRLLWIRHKQKQLRTQTPFKKCQTEEQAQNSALLQPSLPLNNIWMWLLVVAQSQTLEAAWIRLDNTIRALPLLRHHLICNNTAAATITTPPPTRGVSVAVVEVVAI